MKVTKYAHSCLLIEEADKAILVDPGNYSWEAKVLKVDKLSSLDYLFITHQHADHFHLPAIQAILAKFPNCQIVTNQSVAKLLGEARLNATTTPPAIIARPLDLAHEELPWDQPPPHNTGFAFFNKLTHPGDSLKLTSTTDVLALPVTAPWGSYKQAFDLAKRLSPKTIIPIHDWQLKDDIRTGMFYERSYGYFKSRAIDFVKVEDGVTINL